MKTSVQVYLRMLVCLGVTLMLVGNTADAQRTYALRAEGATADEYNVGDKDIVTFELTDTRGEGNPIKNVEMRLVPVGLLIISPERITDEDGKLAVTVEITSATKASLRGIPQPLEDYNVEAQIHFISKAAPTTIVALPPNSPGLSKSGRPLAAKPSDLAVGDTFYQQIWVKHVTDELPLSAWQIDVAFNPRVLQANMATGGDFLEDGGYIPFFEYDMDNSTGKVSASQARIGQKSTTANGKETISLTRSPAGSGTGHLLTIEFTVLEFAEGALGLHNVLLSTSVGTRLSYYAVINPYVVTHQYPREDVNRDGEVNILDLVVVASFIGQSNPRIPRADVNNDGIVSVLDLVAIYHSHWSGPVNPMKKRDSNEWVGAAPAASLADISAETIQGWINLAHVEDDGSIIFDRGIANLQRLLASEAPSETRLLLNYPNPFNPETWIPYQLAKSAEVSLTIYSANGALIRTLALGHRPAGLYHSRGQAAYWDGRNELGTQVASGIYFYTLSAGDFSSTRKMIVRK